MTEATTLEVLSDRAGITFDQALQLFLDANQRLINRHFADCGYTTQGAVIGIPPGGRKFLRVVRWDTDGQGNVLMSTPDDEGNTYPVGKGVHCFISKETGDILKADGWKKPARHARGNIFTSPTEGMNSTGAQYL